MTADHAGQTGGKLPGAKPTGRPFLLTPHLADTIAEKVAAGNYLGTAAALAGIGRATLMTWMRRGRAEDDRLATLLADLTPDDDGQYDDPDPATTAREAPFRDLLHKIEQAQAKAEDTAVVAWVKKVNEGDWRAAATYLARTRPDTWGPRSHVRVTDDESQARIDAAVDAALADPTLALDDPDDPDADPSTT